jgi:hypothetical protein
MNDTGHMPFSWLTPDGFPDVKAAWSGSTPMVMTWRCINWLLYHWDGSFPVDAVTATKTAFPNAADHTANKLVDYWVDRILGIDPAAAGFQGKRSHLVDFMRQNAGADTPLLLNNTDWNNNSSQAYVAQRLQTLVASILMLPEHMLR